MSSLDDRPFPKAALIGAGLMIAVTVAGVGAIQLNKHFARPVEIADGQALETRQLRFVDQGDGVNAYGGHVRVYDAVTGVELPPLRENDGFIRAVLNSLAFERTKGGISAAPVFHLVYWAGNRMTMEDPATGRHVVIGAFGPGNRSVFMRFFEHRDARS